MKDYLKLKVGVPVLIIPLRDRFRDNFAIAFLKTLWDNNNSGQSVFSVFTVIHLHRNEKDRR